MLRMAAVSMTLIVAGLQLFELNGARAQDIAGMEDCTKTAGLDKEARSKAQSECMKAPA